MAIVVEDGTGLTTADSYISVADADTYFSIMPSTSTTDWDALDTTGKENYLKWATRVLDTRSEFEGNKYKSTSALRWPRCGAYDRDLTKIEVTELPTEIAHATAELARILLANDLTTGENVDHLKFLKVDVIEIEYQDGTSQAKISDYINDILNGLGHFRTGRAGFAKITRT